MGSAQQEPKVCKKCRKLMCNELSIQKDLCQICFSKMTLAELVAWNSRKREEL